MRTIRAASRSRLVRRGLLAAHAPWMALVVGPVGAAAQTITGHLRDGESGAPVAGALVELVAADSTRIDAVLSRPDGRYVISMTAEAFGLRVRRIGYAERVVAIPPLAAHGLEALDVAMTVEALELDPLVATGSGRCQVAPTTGRETALLWDQARRALDVAALIDERGLLSFQAVRFQRWLDPERLHVRDERLESSVLDRPFRSPPAEELAREGFVRKEGDETVYFMPDAGVTLSSAFLNGHCFSIVIAEGPRGRLVGLSFEPLPGRTRPDIAGTLWLDPDTGELRTLAYRYVGLPAPADEGFGGRAEFELLDEGSWVVRRWVITMPMLGEERRFLGLGRRTVLTGILEEGGELLAAYTLDGRQVTRPGPERAEGQVIDGDTGEPLARALVGLSGTGRAAQADDSGRFSFEGLPPGAYLATFLHPLLDTLDTAPPALAFELPGNGDPLRLASPARGELFERVCSAPRSHAGILTGRVSHSDGSPAIGANVQLSVPARGRRRQSHQAATDSSGVYRLCGVLADTVVTVGVVRDERVLVEAEVRVPAGGFARADLRLPEGGG